MFHRIPWVFLLVLAIGWPLGAAEEETKKDAKPDEGEKTDTKPPVVKGKWTPVGALSGQVKKMTGDMVTLTVEYPDIDPTQKNPGKANTAAQKQMQSFQTSSTPPTASRTPPRKSRVQQIQAQMQVAMMKQAQGNSRW